MRAYTCAVAVKTDAVQPRLINRELSWIELNARLLELAEDESQPLLERVKFAAIVSSNLDEFFMVRVAGLLEQDEADLGVRSVDGLTPGQALEAIRERVGELTARQSRLWRRDLRPSLATHDIEIVSLKDCSERELKRLEAYFEREIYPILTPLAVGLGQAFPYISGLSLSLGVTAVDPETGEERFARVKVPEGLDRFVSVGKRLVPARVRHRPLPPRRSSPGWRSPSARTSGSPATPTSRSPTTRTTSSRRSSRSCGDAGSATSCASSSRRRPPRRCATG